LRGKSSGKRVDKGRKKCRLRKCRKKTPPSN
jgi:hypothetical protein